MAALGPVELELLDLLCCAAYFRCRVTKVKPGPAATLQRLRWAGLVQLDGFEPSPWAFHDWMERQDGERLVQRIQETAAPLLRIPEPENPPEPMAGEGGGDADARVEASPPILDWPTADEISDELFAFCKLHGIAKSRLSWFLFRSPSAIDRMRGRKSISFEVVAKVRGFMAEPDFDALKKASYHLHKSAKARAVEARSAPLIEDRVSERQGDQSPEELDAPKGAAEAEDSTADEAAPMHADVANDEEPEPEVDLKVNAPAVPPSVKAAPRDPTKPPPGYQSRPEPFTIANPEALSGLQASPKRRGILAAAQKRIDAGLGLGGSGISVHVKMAQRALEAQQSEEARRTDPVEKAKTILRRRFSPVVAAEFLDPPGPKGKFLVGRRLVDQAQLLAMAEQIAA